MQKGSSLNCINFTVPMNIATTKLIQCGIVEMLENKTLHGFCGFVFSLFELFSVAGAAPFSDFAPLFNDSSNR